MNKHPIYLDYMATTPVDPQVIAVMTQYLGPDGHFGNAASATHCYGEAAAIAIEKASRDIALTIGASPEDLVFTSGATESINLAILGAARFYQRKGRHVVTMSTEHKAVLDSCKALSSEGFEVSYLAPKPDGLLDLDSLEAALRTDTILVSIMHVNNEIGVIQDIAAIGALLKGKGIVFHVDAAQSAGKLPIDLAQLPIDLMSFSAHKNYGPKGVGALYLRQNPRIRIQPQTYGGGQQRGLRSGTLPTHQIVGMGEAFRIAESIRIEEQARILKRREQLWEGIKHLPGLTINGSLTHRIAGNLNITIANVDPLSLLPALSELAMSTTSACVSQRSKPSYVLAALGLADEMAYRSLRISIGRFTEEEDIKNAVEIICREIPKLQKK